MAKRSAEEASKRAEEASKARDAQREKARAALEEKDRQLDDARRRIVLAEEEKSEASRANEKTETAAETGRRPGTGDVAVVSGTRLRDRRGRVVFGTGSNLARRLRTGQSPRTRVTSYKNIW